MYLRCIEVTIYFILNIYSMLTCMVITNQLNIMHYIRKTQETLSRACSTGAQFCCTEGYQNSWKKDTFLSIDLYPSSKITLKQSQNSNKNSSLCHSEICKFCSHLSALGSLRKLWLMWLQIYRISNIWILGSWSSWSKISYFEPWLGYWIFNPEWTLVWLLTLWWLIFPRDPTKNKWNSFELFLIHMWREACAQTANAIDHFLGIGKYGETESISNCKDKSLHHLMSQHRIHIVVDALKTTKTMSGLSASTPDFSK